MKKLINFVLFIVTIILTMTGCFGRILQPKSLARLDRDELFSVFAVSALPVIPDEEWDEIHEIETDSYGRVLFVYELSNNSQYNYTKNSCYWAFVCHSSDDKYACYYDDCFVEVSSKEPLGEELTALKERNDWDKPIDRTKLSKVNITDKYFRYDAVNEQKILEIFEVSQNNSENQYYTEKVYTICEDSNGLKLYLYLVILIDKTAKYEAEISTEYVVIQLQNGEFVYKKIDNTQDYHSQITSFKKEHDWDSSVCSSIFRQK